MSRNIYKIKNYKNFETLQERNFYKPLCCIVISTKIKNNKDFYNNLLSTLNFLAHTCPYICIYIFNKNKIKDSNEFENIDENKPFFKMVFKNIEHETITTDIDKFIPTITNIITKINHSIIFTIQKSLTNDNNQTNNNPTNNNSINNNQTNNNSINNNSINNNPTTKPNKKNSKKSKLNENIKTNKIQNESNNNSKIENIKNNNKKNDEQEINNKKNKEDENDEEENEEEEKNNYDEENDEEEENNYDEENDEDDENNDDDEEDNITMDDELLNHRRELERRRKILENL